MAEQVNNRKVSLDGKMKKGWMNGFSETKPTLILLYGAGQRILWKGSLCNLLLTGWGSSSIEKNASSLPRERREVH